jgi:hypothetical protein
MGLHAIESGGGRWWLLALTQVGRQGRMRFDARRDTCHGIRRFGEVEELAIGREPREANGERHCESALFLERWKLGFFYFLAMKNDLEEMLELLLPYR